MVIASSMDDVIQGSMVIVKANTETTAKKSDKLSTFCAHVAMRKEASLCHVFLNVLTREIYEE